MGIDTNRRTMMNTNWENVVFWIGLFITIALTAGEPDLLDAIIEAVRTCR